MPAETQLAAKTPLSRPPLPSIDAPLSWPGASIAVFGPGAIDFGRELARSIPGARLVQVALRHAEGFELSRDQAPPAITVNAHPDALVEALRAVRDEEPSTAVTIGVGPAFAVAVRAARVVWITGGQSALSLPRALAPIARAAHLALEEPRVETARALGARISCAPTVVP